MGTFGVFGVPLRRKPLARLILRAHHCKVWFSVLDEDERRLMDLTIMVVERVRSPLLAKLLTPIIKKLLDAMGGAQA